MGLLTKPRDSDYHNTVRLEPPEASYLAGVEAERTRHAADGNHANVEACNSEIRRVLALPEDADVGGPDIASPAVDADPDPGVNHANITPPTMEVELGLSPAEAMDLLQLVEDATTPILESVAHKLKAAIMAARPGRIYRHNDVEPVPMSGHVTTPRNPSVTHNGLHLNPDGSVKRRPFVRRKPRQKPAIVDPVNGPLKEKDVSVAPMEREDADAG